MRNAAFRQKRLNPNEIVPGDVLVIPTQAQTKNTNGDPRRLKLHTPMLWKPPRISALVESLPIVGKPPGISPLIETPPLLGTAEEPTLDVSGFALLGCHLRSVLAQDRRLVDAVDY